MVNKLKFPIIKGDIPPTKHLSMDDYLKFIILNLKYTVDIKTNRKLKRLAKVNVPFSLR